MLAGLGDLGLSGCGQPAAIAGGGWLRARVQGSVEAHHYEGSGYFLVNSDPRRGISVQFTLHSDGEGPYAGQWFLLYRAGKGRPAKGVYRLAPLDVQNGSPRGFTAYYSYVDEGKAYSYAYTALSGEVEVTESSGDRIEGVFRFRGVLYCSGATRGPPQKWCVGPNTITPGAPEIEVTGSFAAVPAPSGPIRLDSRRGGR
jgi:hypothetical protein